MPAAISILHIVAAILCFAELAIVGYLVSPFSDGGSAFTPSIFGFMMFNSIWSLLVIAYVALAPRYFANLFHNLIALAVEWITMLFWFAGAISFAMSFGIWHEWCGNFGYCHSIRAGIVFGFFVWLLFLAIAVLETIEFRRSRGHRTSAPVVKPYTAA